MRLPRKRKKALKKLVCKKFYRKIIKSRITFNRNEYGEDGFWITPLKLKDL